MKLDRGSARAILGGMFAIASFRDAISEPDQAALVAAWHALGQTKPYENAKIRALGPTRVALALQDRNLAQTALHYLTEIAHDDPRKRDAVNAYARALNVEERLGLRP